MLNPVRFLRVGLCLLAAAAMAYPSARGATVTLKPVADTSLFERFANNNLGNSWLAAGSLRTGSRSRALTRFDLSSIPANAVVNSVVVSFKVVKAPVGAAGSTFELRRTLVSWAEGGKGSPTVGDTGDPASGAEATWVSRGSGGNWSSPGGKAGTDFASAASATKALSGTTLSFATNPALVADVQDWVKNPANNWGWMLLTQSEGTIKTARRFGDRGTANSEPTLVVDYTPATSATPVRLVHPERVGQTFQFQFDAEANLAYTVDFTTNLVSAAWQTLQQIPAVSVPETRVVQDPVVGERRFYRVQSP